MNLVNRRIWGALLFVLLVTPLVLTQILLQAHREKIRHELKTKVLRNCFSDQLIAIPSEKDNDSENFIWKHESEFCYNGEMYDVVNTESRDGQVVYYCWKDTKENHLNDLLQKLMDASSDDDKKSELQKISSLKYFDFLFFPESFWNLPLLISEEKRHNGQYQSIFCETTLQKKSPPPKVKLI